MECIINGKLILKDEIVNMNLYFEDGIIKEISNRVPCDETIIDAANSYVSPGFVDIHTHGRGGIDTMDVTTDTIDQLSNAHLMTGVTTFLPTTMTMPVERISQAIDVISQMKDKVTGAKIGGVHLEGPFINKIYKGAQAEDCIIEPTLDNYKKLTTHPELVKKITLAPEVVKDKELIPYLTSQGVSVSIGHTNATYTEALKAIEAGANSTTHTYNAMTPLKHRDPGVVGASMLHDVYAELILDGVHVSYPAATILYKMKGPEHLVLITDSLEAASMEDGVYHLGGQEVFVKDGQARLKDGTLAGSVVAMNEAIKNARDHLGMSLCEAINCASRNPANCIHNEKIGRLEKGCQADFVFLDDDLTINQVYINGERRL